MTAVSLCILLLLVLAAWRVQYTTARRRYRVLLAAKEEAHRVTARDLGYLQERHNALLERLHDGMLEQKEGTR